MPSGKKKAKQAEVTEKAENKKMDQNPNDDDDEDDDEDEDINLVTDSLDDVMQVDFEAIPLDEADRGGIAKILGQLFLRAKIDLNDLSKLLIKQHPLGCIFRPAEEFAMDDSEDDVYGVLSVVDLHGPEECLKAIVDHLKKRSQKNASPAVLKKMTEAGVFDSAPGKRVGLILNERMLNLPHQIAPPAFQALRQDMTEAGAAFDFSHLLVIAKVHVGDDAVKGAQATPKGKRNKGGADGRGSASGSGTDAVIYANKEEEALFEASSAYFDYAVQSETEQNSLLGVFTGDDDRSYRPFRRVCLIERAAFNDFVDELASGRGV